MAQPKTYGERVDAGEPLAEVFVRMTELHSVLAERPVLGRAWRYAWRHDGHAWSLILNGTKVTVDGVLPFHLMVLRDGLPTVLTDMFKGSVVCGLEEVTLAAIDAAIRMRTQ